ncbi:3-beta hydroxysteroid dehydrogenase [Streptomyces rimosus]|uniref:SDR family oxidoreductase n=1 Tax=Streptomyces rimosus TaxID=1927 RepID=UPI0004D52513|nr:SDR family oxidoreductase [Streptomyces rimosus]KEF08988.1 3-beta hydroxysteroid dehydrogenase [Streptomyces rimosus]
MRVFVTGATGFIGTAVVRELLGAGHTVLGLARSDRAAAALTAAGAAAHRGTLDDPGSLREGAAAADGVIHLAYHHDFSDQAAFANAAQLDLSAVEALGAALEGTGKPLVITSGTLMLASLAPGRTATEEDLPAPGADGPRMASENTARSLARRGVRTSVVRLAPTVHDEGDRGFVPHLIATAREKGVSAYIGDGSNHWPAVPRRDAARLFRLALESAPPGATLHGTAEQGIPFRAIAESIAHGLDLPTTTLAPDQATTHFGFLGALVPLDNPTSSTLTRKQLGWEPVHPGLLEDLGAGDYFGEGARRG